jgi:hypothetical protein
MAKPVIHLIGMLYDMLGDDHHSISNVLAFLKLIGHVFRHNYMSFQNYKCLYFFMRHLLVLVSLVFKHIYFARPFCSLAN